MTSVELRNLEFGYEPSRPVVKDLTLHIDAGQCLAVLGPSGCGKTTTLRLIAGLISPQSGDIFFDDVSVVAVPPEKRGTAMVFQQQTLFPFRTVRENVEFGLKVRKVDRSTRRHRSLEALASVQMNDFADRWPSELSGGQRQRVAIARALVVEPSVLLLDEPLASLDPTLRAEVLQTIDTVRSASSITTVVVTHDPAEAEALGDRVAVVIDGSLRQTGTMAELKTIPVDSAVEAAVTQPAFL